MQSGPGAKITDRWRWAGWVSWQKPNFPAGYIVVEFSEPSCVWRGCLILELATNLSVEEKGLKLVEDLVLFHI